MNKEQISKLMSEFGKLGVKARRKKFKTEKEYKAYMKELNTKALAKRWGKKISTEQLDNSQQVAKI